MYDLIIVGAGPAGLAASIYASRYKIKHCVIGKEIGGMALKAHRVENYPGFESISGPDLMQKFKEQAEKLGAEIRAEEALKIRKEGKEFKVTAASGQEYAAKALILALGTEKKNLNIPGEKEFLGQGVSYCATCDAIFFRKKIVAVLGGSNTAATEALILSEYAEKVYLIYRGERLRAEPIWAEKIENNQKIKIIYQTNVLEIKGKQKVEAIILDKEYGGLKEIKTDGVFIAIGSTPMVSLIGDLGVEIDEQNYLKINPDGATNVAGVYAAGDATTGLNKFKQIVAAVAEGAVAARSVFEYLQKIKAKE